MNVPVQPTSQHDSIKGALPTIWYGTNAVDPTALPWSAVAPGSLYLSPNGVAQKNSVGWGSIGGSFISVDSFGADPTGVTDSTAAINAALAYAGGINLVPAVGDKPICVVLAGRYLISDTIVIPHHVSLIGFGRGRGMNQLYADTTDPLGSWAAMKPMVSLGAIRDGSDQNVFACTLENVDLRGENVAYVGVESFYANELSGCEFVNVTNVRKWGFCFIHTGGQTTYANALSAASVPADFNTYDNTRRGYAQNYYLRECVAVISSSMVEGAAGLYIWGGAASIRGIDGFTASTSGTTNALVLGLTKTAGIRLENCRGVVISRFHPEKLGDGVRIGEYQICRGVTVMGVTGHEAIENLVHIHGLATINYNISCINLFGVSTTVTCTGAVSTGSGVTVPVNAISVPLASGSVLTFTGSKVLTLTASAAAGATSLTGNLTGSALANGNTATWANSTIYDEAYPLIDTAGSAVRIREVNVGLYVLDRFSMFTTCAMEATAGLQMYIPRDIRFSANNKGPILIDRTTATRYRLYVNSGSLAIESV